MADDQASRTHESAIHDSTRILIAEDNAGDQRIIRELLAEVQDHHYETDWVTSVEDARSALGNGGYDILIADYLLDDGCGLDLVPASSNGAALPTILLTGHSSRKVDLAAMQAGAADFISKDDLNPALLERAIRYALEHERTKHRLRESQRDLEQRNAELETAKWEIEAQGTNIIKLAEHLARSTDERDIVSVLSDETGQSYQALADTCRIGIWHIGLDGGTLSMNTSMRCLLNVDAGDAVTGTPFAAHFSSESQQRLAQALETWSGGLSSSYEAVLEDGAPDGARQIAISGSPLRDGHGDVTSVLVTAVDITARRNQEKTIREMARRDPLTGLLNRLAFQDFLPQALANAQRNDRLVSVLYLDLDNFKAVNDTLGHQAGDRLLRFFAEILESCTRESDFAARLGGDEFAITLNNLDSPSGASVVAHHIFERLEEPCVIDGKEVHARTSIGISMFPTDTTDAEQLIKNADLALYRAKAANGGSFAFFDVHMLAEVEKREALERELRQALENQEFRLAYQPQIDLESGAVVALEALLRWPRAGKPQRTPADFLPAAEATGLIVPIGEWVLREACRQAKSWHAAGAAFRLAINLSAAQLAHPGLLAAVAEALDESGLPADRLTFEITESTVIENIGQASAVVDALHELGASVALDDFGTGYSSLSVLNGFPVDQLKIDRSFVRNIGRQTKNAVIVETILDLGRRLDLCVVAEGVENANQLAMLRELGCHEAQGYYFTGPLPAGQIEDWLRRHSQNLRRITSHARIAQTANTA